MLPFDIDTVIFCDDIRQERNGKWLLIGVYGADILVRGLPADLRLSLWIVIRPKEIGKAEAKLRVIGPHGSTLVDGELSVDVKHLRPTIMAMGALPMQIQMAGTIRVEMATKESDEWTAIKSIDLRVAPRPSTRAMSH